jgi:hypothetical protein
MLGAGCCQVLCLPLVCRYVPPPPCTRTSPPHTPQGAVNCETNAESHAFSRALTEAQDLNDFFNSPDPRIRARTAR